MLVRSQYDALYRAGFTDLFYVVQIFLSATLWLSHKNCWFDLCWETFKESPILISVVWPCRILDRLSICQTNKCWQIAAIKLPLIRRCLRLRILIFTNMFAVLIRKKQNLTENVQRYILCKLIFGTHNPRNRSCRHLKFLHSFSDSYLRILTWIKQYNHIIIYLKLH